MTGRVAVAGARGFVGRHLVVELLRSGCPVAALSRRPVLSREPADVAWTQGDLLEPRTLGPWLAGCDTVVNLAFDRTAPPARHVEASGALGTACRAASVRRLIHVSTARVTERAAGEWVDESTPVCALTPYARGKRDAERILQERADGSFELTVLRPTAVLGVGGANLQSLLHELRRGGAARLRFSSWLHGERPMNLVPVATVVSAIRFVLGMAADGGATFLVSADRDPLNVYTAVRRTLLEAWGQRDPVSRWHAPRPLLRGARRLLTGAPDDPWLRYDPRALERAGFVPPVRLEQALVELAATMRPEGPV